MKTVFFVMFLILSSFAQLGTDHGRFVLGDIGSNDIYLLDTQTGAVFRLEGTPASPKFFRKISIEGGTPGIVDTLVPRNVGSRGKLFPNQIRELEGDSND